MITLRERLTFSVRRFFGRLRIDLCFSECDGFDVGAFVSNWKCSRGPFMLHQQYESDGYRGPWRLMVALTPKAFDGFDEGCSK